MRALLVAHAGLVIAGVVSFVLMGIGQAVYGAALPAFARAFGTEPGTAGLLVPAHWVGSALGVVVMFRRGDHVTPRHALGVFALGALILSAGLGFGVTLAGAVVFGMGYGLSTVIYNRRMLAIFGARGPTMLAALNAIFGAGAIGGPLVFVALGSDPGATYLLVAGLAVVAFLAAGGIAPAAAVAGPVAPFRPRLSILAFGALGIGTEACLIGLGPLALIAAGQSEEGAARFLSAFFAAFLVARTLLVGVAHRVPAFRLYTGAVCATGVLALAEVLTGWPWFFVACGAAAGLIFPGFYVAGSRLMGEDARVAPLLISAGLAGGISAPLLLGAAMAWFGNAIFFPVIAALMLAVAACALVALPRLGSASAQT